MPGGALHLAVGLAEQVVADAEAVGADFFQDAAPQGVVEVEDEALLGQAAAGPQDVGRLAGVGA
ncbi:hypothetical protein QA942_27525 [Streptomyces sp. B21-106]|uniref:hypothetical protein n=1 Tax=Streptomyces sp. B21-106 TaxID=3039418 RepID=UPI002FEEDF4E